MVDTDNGKGYAAVGVKSVWEISVFLLNFAVNVKLLQKYYLKLFSIPIFIWIKKL